MSQTDRTCTECGAELADDALRGLCARCLLQNGLENLTDPEATVVAAGGPGQPHALPNVGERFGPYRIVRRLGMGGMGVVYEAEELETRRRVAIKVLRRRFDSPTDRARFLREGRLAASINHPNSVYVYGTEEIDGTPTISMELVPGGTLQRRVKRAGPMRVAAAVDAILQIIAGLEAAQAIGILHRDIKPENCFEDADGTIKIGDFGLSISTAARAEANITATGAIVGTPAFCSPEQLRGDELGAYTDMYSVGGTLFYLLTGRVPFEGHNIAQLTANVLEKPVPSPRDLRKEIPKGLASAIQRCLAKQPTERFKSYNDLRQALAPYSSVAPTPATLSLRCVAGMLDMLVINIVMTTTALSFCKNPLSMVVDFAYESPLKALLLAFVVTLATGLYYGIFEGIWGAAAGKAICRLRVVQADRSPPGIFRALLRALLYIVPPLLPYWIAFSGDPKQMLSSPSPIQFTIQFSYYIVLGLLFCTVRRRNGFAAVHDLATKTRVISRGALEARPVLSAVDELPPAVDAKPTIGPYHVLETLQTGADEQWLLGYDLRLLRKVWIRTLPPGAPSVAAPLRNVSRVGRLRWLTGRRSPEENWDAFEGISGQPLLRLIGDRQPWRQVRFWLFDLAREIGAAEKDGTLPATLTLDRIWITGEGRAKLLDFPAPGLAAAGLLPNNATPAAVPTEETGRANHFLNEMAIAVLEGRADRPVEQKEQTPRPYRFLRWLGLPMRSRSSSPTGTTRSTQTAGGPSIPLPLQAREFFENLPRYSDGNAIAGALAPLLDRVTSISRWRRAAVVLGCVAVPSILFLSLMCSTTLMERSAPGMMKLFSLLQRRSIDSCLKEEETAAAAKPDSGEGKASTSDARKDTDRHLAIYIASHYGATIRDEAAWNSPMALALIKGENRQYVEQCVARYPAPTEEEIAEADAALKSHRDMFEFSQAHLLFLSTVILVVYVCIPALIAALLFRRGLLLRMTGICFVRRDGRRASRLRVLWRAMVAWSPLWLTLLVPVLYPMLGLNVPYSESFSGLLPWLCCAWFGMLAGLSVALPERGLPDRLAGIWPVPR